jgi:hypothetical protein
VEKLNLESVAGYYQAIALTPGDEPVVAFAGGNESVAIVQKHGDQWSLRNEADANLGEIPDLSVAVGSDGRPQLTYLDRNSREIRFARWNGSSWDRDTVATDTAPSYQLSTPVLQLDSENNPHVVFSDLVRHELIYTRRNGTVWERESIDAETDPDEFVAFVLSKDGSAHVVFSDRNDASLIYGRKSSSGWSFERLPGASDFWEEKPALAVDSQGRACVVYTERSQAALVLASRVPFVNPDESPANNSSPGDAVSEAIFYPNPFRPAHGDTEMRFESMPAGSTIRIVSFGGETIREMTADENGAAPWDGRNDAAESVASGVYLVLIEHADQRESFKIAVQR